MARTADPRRYSQILDAAAEVFRTFGYRGAQVSRIADVAGVAPGTVYLYFENKEALFFAAVQQAFLQDDYVAPSTYPVKVESRDETLRFIRREFRRSWRLASVDEVLEGRPRRSIAAEVEGIIRELYRGVARLRFAIRLIERATPDWPELYSLHFVKMRRDLLRQLTRYLDARIASGDIRPVPHSPTTARVILENCAWFAVHRHFTPDSAMLTDEESEECVVDLLLHGLVASENSGRR